MHLRDLKDAPQLFKEAFNAWLEVKAPRLGASLAYYTVFAIAPLLIIAMRVAGFIFGKQAARNELSVQLGSLMGHNGEQAVQSLIDAANRPEAGNWASIIAGATLLIGATAMFVELQDALNTIWDVRAKPGTGMRTFIRHRLLSFAMVAGVGFLLLVSLVLSTVLAVAGKLARGAFPLEHFVWMSINFFVSLGVVTFLFAMIFKVLPDVKLAWRKVWGGALVTAVLFNIGKALIGLYLGRSTLVSLYGATGSSIVLLVWVYYSAQILFFGAEITRVYAQRKEPPMEDEMDAKRPVTLPSCDATRGGRLSGQRFP